MTRWRRAESVTTLGLLVIMATGCGTAGSVADSAVETTRAISSPSPTAATTGTTPTVSVSTSAAVPPSGPEPSAGASPSDRQPVVPPAAELEAGRSTPVEDPYYPDTSNPEVDALHYDLDLAWDGTILAGTATVIARAAASTDSVRLDLSSALLVDSVELDGDSIDFAQMSDGLTMSTGALQRNSTYTLTISYAGIPTPTPAPSRRPDLAEGLGWVSDIDGSVHTFQEPYGAFTWYPVNDHPSDEALYDASITTTGDDVGVFNGQLISSEQTGSGTTNEWHVDEPVASYLTTIAIGPYTQHLAATSSGMELSLWLLPSDERLLPILEDEATAAYDWLADSAGPYPFSSLGVVVVGGNSAMETQTLITMSRGAVRRADAVLEHEMSHQWFGDSVGPLDWQAVWLNEGWAMYMQQWYEADTGLTPYGGGMDRWRRYDQAARVRSGPPGDYDPQTFGDVNIYLGPAMMLDEIRQQIGDAAFFELVKAWPAEHENATVDRADFESWLNDQTGEDFGPLLHTWLDSARTPR